MSLHKFAEQVAAHGRGDDSLLIHMTPDEVQRLQAFAEANGRSLTINPHTGLPEAGMLSDLFKAVAPIALGAFLGPAGMGLTIGGLSSAATAGLLTGGITTLATGSLSRGLMAGLGAYGGAGLGEGLANAGTAAMGTSASLGAGIPADMAFNLADAGVEGAANVDAASKAIAQVQPSSFSKMSAGLGSITSSPETLGSFAKDNWKSLAAAATPIMAGAMVPTTTKMPENTNPAYIRQKLYDPYTQTYKSLTPVKASEWGGRSFSDAYTNPQTGEMATLQPRAPGMASGGSAGIVALAAGGVSDQQVVDWFKANPGASDQTIAAAMQQYDVSPEQIARATGTQGQQADYEKRFVQAINTPGTSAEEFMAATKDIGLQNQALANAMQNAGMSQAAQYASTHNLADTGDIKGTDFYKNIGYTPGALPGDQGGLEGLYANINYSASGLQNLINSGKMTVAQAQDAALAELARTGTSLADVKAATGKSFGDLFTPKKEEKKTTVVTDTGTGTGVVAGGTKLDTATTYDNGAFGNYGSGNKTGVDYLGRTVSIATPGDIVTNPDQTRTVVPNIPGRTYGGFTGMDQVKSRYTAGGGSLGYTSPVPRTMADFEQLYNKQTGDSLAAYNYLMGKGANNNAYPVQSQAASSATGIQRPYWTAGMKYKPKYLTYDKDGNVVTSTTSPNAPATATADLTKAKTINVLDPNGNPEVATLSSDGNYYTSSGVAYDVTGNPVVAKAEGGMTYAMGGGLGSLGSYSDGGRLLKGPGDGVSDSIPATIGAKGQPARLADGEFVVPARIVSELGNGSTEAGAKKLYAMMDRVQKARGKTTGKNKVAANTRADKYLPA